MAGDDSLTDQSVGLSKPMAFKSPKTAPLFKASSSTSTSSVASDASSSGPSGLQRFKFAPAVKRQPSQHQQSSPASVIGQGSSNVASSIFGKPHFRIQKANIFEAQLGQNANPSTNPSTNASPEINAQSDDTPRLSERSSKPFSFGLDRLFLKPTGSMTGSITVDPASTPSSIALGRDQVSSTSDIRPPAKRLFSGKKLVPNSQLGQQQPLSTTLQALQESEMNPVVVSASDDQSFAPLKQNIEENPKRIVAQEQNEEVMQISCPSTRARYHLLPESPMSTASMLLSSKSSLAADLPTPPAATTPISAKYFMSQQILPSPETPTRHPSTRRQSMIVDDSTMLPPSKTPTPQPLSGDEDVEEVFRSIVTKYKTQLKHKDETIRLMTVNSDELKITLGKQEAALSVYQERVQAMDTIMRRQGAKWEQNRVRCVIKCNSWVQMCSS